MKTTIVIAILIIFSFLNFLAEFISDENIIHEFYPAEKVVKNSENKNETESKSNYNISINFDSSRKKILVSGSLTWVNKTGNSFAEIYMNIPTNNGKLKYKINYDELFEKIDYKFVIPQSMSFYDSSLVKIKFCNKLQTGDTLHFNFSYDIVESPNTKWGDNLFIQMENWYPKIAVYSSGKFHAYPQHKYIKSFSGFSDFKLKITIPKSYQISTPGIKKILEENGDKIFYCTVNNVSSFDWILFNNYVESSFELKAGARKIHLQTFTQRGNHGYISRYEHAIEKYFKRLAGRFDYPFNSLTIVELPQNEKLLEKSYPTILVVKPKIISPEGSHNLEYGIALLLTEQFMNNIIVPDNFQNAWIAKGVSAYLAEELVRSEYGKQYSYFRLARYYPIKGILFLSFNEIPLIYTLGNEVIPEGGRVINEYYKNIIYCDCSVPSYYFPDYELYNAASVVKPQLSLITLERYLGSEKLQDNIAKYYKRYKYQHPTSEQFLEIITNGCNKENLYFINDLLQTGKRFDYAIKYLKKISKNKYELLAERRKSGVAPVEINIYTERDTIKLNWDGKENFKRFVFNSQNEVVAAELDSHEKNLLDLNFSNNSYIVANQYWGSFSLSSRIFFWIQNALLLLGGIG